MRLPAQLILPALLVLVWSAPGSGARGASNARPSPQLLQTSEVRQAQQRLAELGFWIGPPTGRWDEESRQALVAFQKVAWRKPTGRLTRVELGELMRGSPPTPREINEPHIEVDLARQVLFMVDAQGKVANILPISSGSGRPFRAPGWQGTADTPCGHLSVFAKAYGWHKSPLGEMHNPMYIVGGIAIHGSEDVPAKPVSHGCIRIPMFASNRLTRLVPRNTPVFVYGCKDDAPPAAIPPAPPVVTTQPAPR